MLSDAELVTLAQAVVSAKAALVAADSNRDVWSRNLTLRKAYDALWEACEPDAILALMERVQRAEKDSARYRFLRDNPLQLRAIDGNARWYGQITAEHFNALTDAAREAR